MVALTRSPSALVASHESFKVKFLCNSFLINYILNFSLIINLISFNQKKSG